MEPPTGYEHIRVRKSDGTIITVKRKLAPGDDSGDQDYQQEKTAKSDAKYRIVTVRMPNGSRGRVRRVARPDTDREKPTVGTEESPIPTTTRNYTNGSNNVEENKTEIRPESFGTTFPKQKYDALDTPQPRGPPRIHDDVGTSMTYLPELMDGDELLADNGISESDEDSDEEFELSENGEDLEMGGENDDEGHTCPITVAGAAAATAVLEGAKIRSNNGGSGPNEQGDRPRSDTSAVEGQGTIRRRWADFSFYFMASLSVVLPVLFLVLTAFILAMDGRSASSNWGMIIDPIKIAVTIWPIAFAAVTAQGFKSYATYRVERGVKLIELEQLVGSNSFGSVMKQPFLLRRLDVLTLIIFFIWALSPIGSQALIRVYTLERGFVSDEVPALYIPLLGENRLLSPGAETRFPDATTLSEHWQALCVYFLGEFLPEGGKVQTDPAADEQDLFHHPFPRHRGTTSNTAPSVERRAVRSIVSAYGLPVALSPPVIPFLDESIEQTKHEAEDANVPPPFENVTFPITSSYFDLTCDKWRTTKRSLINDTLYFSLSETMGLRFKTSENAVSGIDQMQFATLLNGSAVLNETDWAHPIRPSQDWEYAAIDCTLRQVFYNSTITCWIDAGSDSISQSFSCSMDYLTVLAADQVLPEWHTNLTDFSGEFVKGGSPYPILHPYTPLEHWAIKNEDIDGSHSLTDEPASNLSPLKSTPAEFAESFAVVLNGFITVAHCPECVPVTGISSVNPGLLPPGATPPDRVLPPAAALYVPPEGSGLAQRIYSPPGLIFSISWPWAWTLLACVLILLIVGVASVVIESFLVAPDVLGYASTLVRNSLHLHLPKTTTKAKTPAEAEAGTRPIGPMGMSGSERARIIGGVKVMMQDVKPHLEVGKIALGLKHKRAERLKRGRIYR